MLLGCVQNFTSTIYLPIKSECVDNWAPRESGITRVSVAEKNTMYPYLAITLAPNLRTEIERVLNGGVPASAHDRIMVLRSRRSWLKCLRFCPICAAEDIAVYGETYWHRKHQLQGSQYCTKHQIPLVDSNVTTKRVMTGLYPASSEVWTDFDDSVPDKLAEHKDKFLKIGQESEWLLNYGLSVDWQANGHDKYMKLFRDMGIASVNGSRWDYNALNEAINNYWGNEFINTLFYETTGSTDRLNDIRVEKMHRFLPLHHILLMCIAKGSAQEFVTCEVSDNPFGTAPFVCENPICAHYHTDGAICTDVKRFNSRAVGHFFCENCGMRYKITRANALKGITVITDYGHLWKTELIRCSRDKTISNQKTAEFLKCSIDTMMLQKKKLGLLRPLRYDVDLGPEEYYKSSVAALIKEYGEVTCSLIQEKVPGAYDYLKKHHYQWLCKCLTSRWETSVHRTRIEYMRQKVQKAVEQIMANPPNRQISFGYIAEIAGLTRDNLRSNSQMCAYVEGIVESRKDWFRRRITTMYLSKPIKDRPCTAIELCRAASIDISTYMKYKEFFEEVVNELNKS